MSRLTCHTLGGFKAAFFVEHGRKPTEQEIFNAGMRGGRDIIWPKNLINNPTNQKMVLLDEKLVDEWILHFCAFAPLDLLQRFRDRKSVV